MLDLLKLLTSVPPDEVQKIIQAIVNIVKVVEDITAIVKANPTLEADILKIFAPKQS